jgi:hypothetical protein
MFKLLLNFHVRADDVLRAFLITSIQFDSTMIPSDFKTPLHLLQHIPKRNPIESA